MAASRCVWCKGSPLVPVKSQQPNLAAAQHSSALKELKHALHTSTHTHWQTHKVTTLNLSILIDINKDITYKHTNQDTPISCIKQQNQLEWTQSERCNYEALSADSRYEHEASLGTNKYASHVLKPGMVQLSVVVLTFFQRNFTHPPERAGLRSTKRLHIMIRSCDIPVKWKSFAQHFSL